MSAGALTDTVEAAHEAPGRARRAQLAFHRLRISDVEQLTDDAVALTFDVPEPLRGAYDFTPGQHLTLRRELDGEEVRRSYSICAPAGQGRLRVAVKRLDGGTFSRWAVDEARAGDELDVLTPAGRFGIAFEPGRARRYAAVAAGSGITPVVSLVETALEVEQGSSFTLVYGNRTAASVMFLEELADLKNRYPARFQVLHVLSQEPQPADLLTGRIDEDKLRAVLRELVDPAEVQEWFLCGPQGMVEAAQRALAGAGVPDEQVHHELFHVAGAGPVERGPRVEPADDAPRAEVTAVLDGRASSVKVALADDDATETLLDAVLRTRADAPFACKGGVCGTCRAKVTGGEVRMKHDYALEGWEKAAGYVLTCQARPTTAAVTVDFDA